MAGARLVHEGAVLTGPHGGRGGMRGAPDGSVLLKARKLHPDGACREGEVARHSHREDVSLAKLDLTAHRSPSGP